MEHMEEGIAKAYDTAPPTPWAQYSGKDIPQLPDNVAGTTQKVTEFTSIPSGWVVNSGTPVSSFDDNEWQVVSNANSEGYGRPIPAGSIVIMYIKCISGSAYIFDSTIGNVKLFSPSDKWNLFIYYVPTARTIVHYSNSGTYRIKAIYIGTGAYDRLVFDNSYHYRHLLNNAVVPTPQGLYFNGATSYLRSKDKVTLPDVMPFHAIINCAVKTTAQTFFYAEEGDAIIAIYRKLSSGDLVLDYYNTNTSSVVSLVIGTGFFTGLDNTDVDTIVKIDFTAKTVTSYKEGTQVQSISIPYILKPASTYIYYGYKSGAGLLGYMRNIQLYDTSLTDTQRNWLAQGNTPPILYDYSTHALINYGTIKSSVDLTLSLATETSRIRVANTSSTKSIELTPPSGYTVNDQSVYTLAPKALVEFEVIGTNLVPIGLQATVLWENPSPNSSFSGAVTLSDTIENYSFFEVTFRKDTVIDARSSVCTEKLSSLEMFNMENMNRLRKITSAAGTTVTFGDGGYYSFNTSTPVYTSDNLQIIPLSIKGYKKTSLITVNNAYDWFTGLDRLTFGQEYLYAIFNKWKNNSTFKVVMAGDSTTEMYKGGPDGVAELLNLQFVKFGLPTATIYNTAVSGQNATGWISNKLATEIGYAPDLYIIRIGFNNEEGATNEERAAVLDVKMNSALTTIRATLPVSTCSIVIMAPNSSNDDINNRGVEMKKLITKVLRRVARTYGCAFFDTFKYWIDAGVYASNMYDNPYGDGRHIHPNGIMNRVIISELSEFICPSCFRS
jgi:lysophospholipase L1-like esterase